jgi:hypothetical protein
MYYLCGHVVRVKITRYPKNGFFFLCSQKRWAKKEFPSFFVIYFVSLPTAHIHTQITCTTFFFSQSCCTHRPLPVNHLSLVIHIREEWITLFTFRSSLCPFIFSFALFFSTPLIAEYSAFFPFFFHQIPLVHSLLKQCERERGGERRERKFVEFFANDWQRIIVKSAAVLIEEEKMRIFRDVISHFFVYGQFYSFLSPCRKPFTLSSFSLKIFFALCFCVSFKTEKGIRWEDRETKNCNREKQRR